MCVSESALCSHLTKETPLLSKTICTSNVSYAAKDSPRLSRGAAIFLELCECRGLNGHDYQSPEWLGEAKCLRNSGDSLKFSGF